MKHLIVLVVGVMSAAIAASPAAADPRIGLSRDGARWVTQLADPLFESSVRWVPGDVRTATFFVRNQSDDRAELSIDLLGADADSLLETGDLTIMARGGGSRWVSTDEPGTHRLVSTVPVDDADRSRVDITVSFDPASVNVSQTRALDLELRVHLQQSVPSAADGTDDGGGLLPDTGGPTPWAVAVGLALLALGIAATSPRRQEADHHV